MRGKGRLPVADYTLAAQVLCDLGSASQQQQPERGGMTSRATSSDRPRAQGQQEQGEGEQPQGVSRSKRGVYSFCMCPGGQVVPTSTEEDELCVNGMSFSRR